MALKSEVSQEEMIKIGEVARQLGISIRTIHMYEREGLFIAYKNSAGTRYFTSRDVDWLVEVRRMIKAGLSIAGIRRLLSLIPCWESKKCQHQGKENCPVITDSNNSCWANKENLCHESAQECRQCDVYDMRFCVGTLKHVLDIRFKTDQFRDGRDFMKEIHQRNKGQVGAVSLS